MAQWTNIPTDRIEPGKPIRAIDGLALRDNPIAIAEGASGAPRVQTNGIANSAVTTSKIANSNVTTAKIANSNVTAAKLATGGNENNWVRARTATSTAGQVGTYALVTRVTRSNSSGRVLWGATAAGSTLKAVSTVVSGGFITGPELVPSVPERILSGTWRIMGLLTGGRDLEQGYATLALRIS